MTHRRPFSAPAIWGSATAMIFGRPLDLLAWWVATTLVVMAPIAWLIARHAPVVLAATQQLGSGSIPQALNSVARILLQDPAPFAIAGVGFVLVVGSVFRAGLLPRGRYLSAFGVGIRDAWLVLSAAVYGVYSGLVLALSLLLGGAALMGLGALNFPGAAHLLFIIGLALALFLAWLLMRLSLLAPAAFAAAGLPVARVWRMTRGQAAELFAALVLPVASLALAAAVFVRFMLSRLLRYGLIHTLAKGVLASAAHGHELLIVLGLAASLALTLITAFLVGSWACAYRALEEG